MKTITYMVSASDTAAAEAIVLEIDPNKTEISFATGIGADTTETNYLCGWTVSDAEDAQIKSKFSDADITLQAFGPIDLQQLLDQLGMHIIEEEE